MYSFKKTTLLTALLYLLSSVILFAQESNGNNELFLHQKDSLLHIASTTEGENRLSAYSELSDLTYRQEPNIDSVIHYYSLFQKEAQKQKNTEIEGVARFNTVKMLTDKGEYDLLLQRIEDDLNFLSSNELWEYYYSSKDRAARSYFGKGMEDKAFEELNKAYEEALEAGHKRELSIVLTAIGRLYGATKRYAERLKTYLEALEIENQYEDVSHNKLEAYFNIVNHYILFERFPEAEEYLQKWEADLHKAGYNEDNNPIQLSNLYTTNRNYYDRKKDYTKVIEYTNKIEELRPHHPITIYSSAYYRALAFMNMKKYKEALEQINKGYEVAIEINDQGNAIEMRRIKSHILILMGEKEKAINMVDSTLITQGILLTKNLNTKLDELHTLYGVDKKNHEIEQQKASIQMRNLWLLIAAILFMAGIVFIIIRSRYTRSLKNKNIGLVKQIQEQDQLHKKLDAEKKELETFRRLLQEKNGNSNTEEEKDELFESLEKLMTDKKVYTDPEINRKALADALGTNEKYLRETIKKNLNMTVNEYITAQRLKYARELLMLPADEYTIEAIAIDSGFGSRSTFHTQFREQYGLTPVEFRKFTTQ